MSVLSDLGGRTDRADRLCAQLDELNEQLRTFPRNDQQRSPQLREWERFALIDGGQATAGGALTVGGAGSNLRPAPNGWEAYVHSVAVTVSGASATATVTNYNGDVADGNLFDYANAMLGSSPSRIIAFYDLEQVYVETGDAISIVVASAAASAAVTVRVTGRRRMMG